MHPEQRLIPLDCACSFGSVIPLSAVWSKKAFSLPGAREDFCAFHPAPSAHHLSAWITVPPIGYRHALQPHFTLKTEFMSAVEPRVKWKVGVLCFVLFFPVTPLLLLGYSNDAWIWSNSKKDVEIVSLE